ncbi:MAG: type II secretion system GspH family protein [Campylobacter sp.]|uniref:type II secretion system protein n=1 Tax=Campylobacter sp. TaxID=205 RepID=UPI002AA6DCD8|nr:type II secretion system protein [Campylobacter sp.]MCI6178682.1 type II secretion system GspH family protein [Campylobacter sp.]
MKKGFTMIELIFVIVILGILASVAIPRLAATREDAEISATVANLRTLVSDVTAYYTAKGEFPTSTKWSEITNVPLDGATSNAVGAAAATTATAKLKAGGKDCIGVRLVNKAGTAPAHIVFSKEAATGSGVCKQVADSDPVKKAYLDSKISYTNNKQSQTISNAIAIGSSTSVY